MEDWPLMNIPFPLGGIESNRPGENNTIRSAGIKIFAGDNLIFISLFEVYRIAEIIDNTTGLIILNYI